MQQLELTGKHRKQLIEMCEKLFSQFKHWGLDVDSIFIWFVEPEEQNTVYISWFEFCLLHIAPRIEQLDTNFYASTNMNQCAIEVIRNKVHPVDYLYKQFKLLK